MRSGLSFPPALATRLDALREDEHAREELQYSVQAWKAQKASASAPPALTPRQRLMQQLLQKDAKADDAAGKAPSSARAAPKKKKKPPAKLQPLASPRSAASPRIEAPKPLPPPPPPLPLPKDANPSVLEAIESARGLRVRDPLEVASGEAGFIRRRQKMRELSGAPFRTGVYKSEAERLADVINEDAGAGGGGGGGGQTQAQGESPRLQSSKWLGGDFVAHSGSSLSAKNAIADVAILSGAHRAPYLDGGKRQQLVGRQRDPSKELGQHHVRMADEPHPRETIAHSWKGLKRSGGRYVDELDGGNSSSLLGLGIGDDELRKGRSLISTNMISAHRR